MFRQIPNEVLQAFFCETMSHPIETGAQIVHKLLVGVDASNFAGKVRSLLHAWGPSFNPEQIRVWSKLSASLGRCFHSSFLMVKALASSWNVPRKEYGRLSVLLSELPSSS